MGEMQWIRSHVELLLEREWDVCPVETDGDGDWPFRFGTAVGWVAVVGDERPMVLIAAHAVCGLRPTAKLLRELNDVQLRATSARIALANGCVLVSQVLSPVGLTQPVLNQALVQVGVVADDIGGLLAAAFDGHTPFAPDLSEPEQSSGQSGSC